MDWALNSETNRSSESVISGGQSLVTTHGDETETGGARKTLGDAPEVANDLHHIFESALQFGADRVLEGCRIVLDIWHESEEVLRNVIFVSCDM